MAIRRVVAVVVAAAVTDITETSNANPLAIARLARSVIHWPGFILAARDTALRYHASRGAVRHMAQESITLFCHVAVQMTQSPLAIVSCRAEATCWYLIVTWQSPQGYLGLILPRSLTEN